MTWSGSPTQVREAVEQKRPTEVEEQMVPADYRIIDPHVHVWKHDPEFPFAQGQNVPERDATPETLLGLMNSNGVSKTVLIQVIHYRYDNRFLAHTPEAVSEDLQGCVPSGSISAHCARPPVAAHRARIQRSPAVPGARPSGRLD